MVSNQLEHLLKAHFGNGKAPAELEKLQEDIKTLVDEGQQEIEQLKRQLLDQGKMIASLELQLLSETSEVKAAHEELSRLFNQVHEGFFSRDILGDRYITMSIGCEKIYGYSISEFFSNSGLWFDVIHPEDRPVLEKETAILMTGESILSTYRIIHKDGSIRWLEVKAIPYITGNILYRVDGVVNDITERKKAELAVIDSEVKYRSFFEHNLDGILLGDPSGGVLEVNPAACKIFRASAAEICNYSWEELLDFGAPEFSTGTFKGEVNFNRKDGSSFTAEISSSLFQDSNGADRTCVIINDITDRKNAEAALLRNERQLDLIYNTVTESIFMIMVEPGEKFRFVSINQAFARITGSTVDQLVGQSLDETLTPHYREHVLEKYRTAFRTKQVVSWEEQWQNKKTGKVIGIVTITPVVDQEGNCNQIIGSVQDITERVKVEENFKASQKNFQSLVNTIDGIVWETDAATSLFIFVSRQAEVILGYPVEQWINDPMFWRNHLHPDDREATIESFMLNIRQQRSHQLEYRMIAADGSEIWFQDNVTVVSHEDGSGYIRGIMVEITDRKKYEQTIREGEEKYRLLVEQASDAILINSHDGKLTDVNQRACDMLGYTKEALETMNVAALFSEGKPLIDTFPAPGTQGGKISVAETSVVHSNGSLIPADISSRVLSDGRVMAIVRDISERKKSEKIVQDSQERIELIMSAALDAIICMDPDDKISFWNPQAERIFGWKSDEVKGLSLSALIIPERYRERHLSGMKKYLETGKGPVLNTLLELSAIRRNGEEFPVELTILPIRQAGQEFFCAFIRDITERIKAVQQITDSERRYRLLFEQNLAGVYQTTPSGEILNCNQAFASMLGYAQPSALLHLNIAEHELPNINAGTYLEELQEQGRLYNYEVVLKTRQGGNVHVIKNISLFKDPVSGQEVFYGIMIDITERKLAESLLRESETRYRQIVETAQEGIWMMDEHFTTIFVNRKMCELLEYSNEEMLGSTLQSFILPGASAILNPLIQHSRAGQSYNLDLPLQTKMTGRIWVSLSASPIFDQEGRFTGALAMVTDITKRKLDEEQIRRSEANLDIRNKELRRKNTELEQFAYVASHDLQEPLRTTSSFVQLLKKQYEGKLDEKADKYLRFILESSDRMKVFIKDLLDYSRIGTKNELEQVDCNRIIRDVIADLHSAITESGAVVTVNELPVISGYSTELKQLFQNLMINAIKFKRANVQPEVQVSSSFAGDQWIFSFSDNGIGIDKAHNDRIFIIFQRLHTRSEFQGSGIGLSHCKKIVELHHGKIWVESTPGKGSTFYFSIPVNDHPPSE